MHTGPAKTSAGTRTSGTPRNDVETHILALARALAPAHEQLTLVRGKRPPQKLSISEKLFPPRSLSSKHERTKNVLGAECQFHLTEIAKHMEYGEHRYTHFVRTVEQILTRPSIEQAEVEQKIRTYLRRYPKSLHPFKSRDTEQEKI